MESPLTLLAACALLAWLYLAFLHGGFWRADQRMDGYSDAVPRRAADWPGVVAVVPARDEAPTIGRAVASLLAQDYSGPFSVVVVDDASRDGAGFATRVRVLQLPAPVEHVHDRVVVDQHDLAARGEDC